MRDPVQHSEQAAISRSRQQDRTDGTPPPFLTVTKLGLVVLQGRSAGPNGQSYELPHQDRFRTDLLDGADLREREKQERILHNLRGQGRTGTLVSDGRKNVAKRPMVNFIFHCTEGVFLIECVDSSDWESEVDVSKGATKGDWLAMKLDKAIGQVNEIAGGEVVDQVLLDSAGDCKKARRLLKAKRPKLVVGACAAHTLDLLIEDIGKIKRFANVIAKARVITKVIMNHGAVRVFFLMCGRHSLKSNFPLGQKGIFRCQRWSRFG